MHINWFFSDVALASLATMMTIVVKGWDYDEPDKKRKREWGMREEEKAPFALIASVESRSVPREGEKKS